MHEQPVDPKMQRFANDFAQESLSGAFFNAPPPPPNPDEPTRVEDEEGPLEPSYRPMPPVKLPPPPPPSPLVALGQRAVAPEPVPQKALDINQALMVSGDQGIYKGHPAVLNEQEQAAIGRIVLEAAQRVLREKLDEAKAAAPRRRRSAQTALPLDAPEPPAKAKRRGRPPGAKNKPKSEPEPEPMARPTIDGAMNG